MGDVNDEDDDIISSLDISDVDREATRLGNDAISAVSGANTRKRSKSRKRVQFLPDGILVRVREISPRSNKSSASDDSTSDTSSGSDDSDSETVSDSTDTSERDTPSPVAQPVSDTQFTTMLPLVWSPSIATKESYRLSKQETKTSATVAKITGGHRTTFPPPNTYKTTTTTNKHTLPPRQERPPNKQVKTFEKNKNGKHMTEDKKLKSTKKKPLLIKEGKATSQLSHTAKQLTVTQAGSKNTSGSHLAAGSKPILAQRRINSAPPSKSIQRRRKPATAVSTSLTSLHCASPQPADIMGRSMQCLSLGKLYTIDGFIFPSHQVTDNLQLPELSDTSTSMEESLIINRLRRTSADDTQRFMNTNGVYMNSFHHHQSQQQLSPTSANRRHRLQAWQMANGSLQNTSLSISQMWENLSTDPHGSGQSSYGQVLHNEFFNE